MKFKSVITLSVFMLASLSFADDCKKEDAKKAVEWACDKISKEGKKALTEINAHKFCGQNYVWIQDTPEVRMVQHPIKPKLNHTAHGGPNKRDLKDSKDKKGFPLFVEFDKKANAEKAGGWVEYVWPKPMAEDATPKVSFVKKCDGPLNWIAGSGVWK